MQPATWMQGSPGRGLYVAEAGSAEPRLLVEADAQALAWREDGQLLALSRQHDGALRLVLVDAAGREERLLDLPLKRADSYAVDWDVARAQILIASRAGGEVEYWLVRLGLEDRP